ncbi:transcriptional regulator, BadM/Rrf2 family [Shimia marina]|uniref:HTH-type transcriptional repressor NsrR n=2 Tax=Shimia marina TaxID=321267 RepID=A0A0N7LRW0_9RHOB|nr:HTH-type transcriptional repressor NsrR [Shimia marina]SFE45779.1 transcriptional regulator, BadM/Rrf2 family [Shimia marina]
MPHKKVSDSILPLGRLARCIEEGSQMRITKRTNIAMRVLMFCAANRGRLVTKHEIAKACNASENHLAQVIHQLALMKVLKTHRGRNGGLELAHEPSEIQVGAIFREMEAPVPLAECFADVDDTCPLVSACRLRDALHDAAEAFYKKLDEVTLDTLTCNNQALLSILAPVRCSA